MRKASYLVIWWMSQVPHAALFENRIAAEAAASVRNALMVNVSGDDVRIDAILDWYRRNDDGEPMPAEWRDVLGKVQVPWPSLKPSDRQTAGQVPLALTEKAAEPQIPKARGA